MKQPQRAQRNRYGVALGLYIWHADLVSEPMSNSARDLTKMEILRDILSAFRLAGVDVWLLGGWGIDGLLGHESREHKDVDLIARRDDRKRVREALRTVGEQIVEDTDVKLIFFRHGCRSDIIYFYKLPDGTLVSDLDADDPFVYPWPPGAFPREPNGYLLGMPCNAVTWEAQYVAKEGYTHYKKGCPLRQKDRADLAVIRRHLGPGAEEELKKYFPGVPRHAPEK